MKKYVFSVFLLILLAVSVSAFAETNESHFCNGTDTVQIGTYQFYSNSEDEDKLYKYDENTKLETKVCDDHIISLLKSSDDEIYFLSYQNGITKLKQYKLDGSTEEIKSVNEIVNSFAIRDNIIYFVQEGGIYKYDLYTRNDSEFISNESIAFLYFSDYSTLKYYIKNSDLSYDAKEYNFYEDNTSNKKMKLFSNPVTLMSANSYSPRLTAPATDNPYYTSLNVFHTSGYGMVGNGGNCTCYAYGRSYENLGYKPSLSTANAENWYNYNINNGFYGYGKTPYLGAVAVWAKGVIGNSSDGAGHVAVVEVIDGDTVTTSESGWKSFYFKTVTRSASNSNFSATSSYTFQGFIYVMGQSGSESQPEPGTITPEPVDLGADFFAYIGNQDSGKWLTNVNGNLEGAYPDGDTSFMWHFVRRADGSYSLENMKDNSYVDVTGYSTTPGTNVYLNWGYTGEVNQRFYIRYRDNAYYFSPVYTDMCLDLSLTTNNVELWNKGENWSPQKFNIAIINQQNGRVHENLGKDFYAYVGHRTSGKWLANINDNVMCVKPTGDEKFIWHFVRRFDGSYSIENIEDHSFVDVTGYSTTPGTNVYLNCGYTGEVNQRFYIYLINGAYYFSPVYTNMHLDMNANTGNIELWEYATNWEPQEFNIQTISKQEGTIHKNIGSDLYCKIKQKSMNKYWTNDDGNIVGANEDVDKGQVWHLVRRYDGSYSIENMKDHSYVDVTGYATTPGTNVYLNCGYTGEVNQRFYIYLINGAYYFSPAYTNMHLDMSTSNYNLELWNYATNWAPQEFEILEIQNSNEVAFDPNGGEVANAKKEVTYASTYGEMPIPKKKGYNFLGWFTSPEGEELITSDTKVNITENQTLYAHWEYISPHTETQIVKNGNSYSVSISQINLDTAKIIIGGYKNNIMNDTKILNANSLAPITFTGNFDTFKVMAWENLSSLNPLCEAETIPQDKWIIE